MLTSRQEEIMEFVRSYQREHSIPPSTRSIQKHFGFNSRNAAHCHLKALAAKDALIQLPDGSWGLRAAQIQGLLELPVYGAIPAGRPDDREQETLETLPLNPALFGFSPARARKLWALRVTGDSMIEAHICDGDLGIFEQREARPGEIIAALVDGTTTTLKRLVQVQGRLLLRAANPRYADIVPLEGLECQGVLVALLRRSFA
jgi:repressor LexA